MENMQLELSSQDNPIKNKFIKHYKAQFSIIYDKKMKSINNHLTKKTNKKKSVNSSKSTKLKYSNHVLMFPCKYCIPYGKAYHIK